MRVREWSWRKRLVVGSGALSLLFLFVVVVIYATTTIPPASAFSTGAASRVLYADGGTIGRIGSTNRIPVSLNRVPDPVQKAVLAAEDRQFYSEPGISPRGIARAIIANLRGGGIQQGGSTITQQYAKNAFLTQQRTFSRKIKEVFISLKLAQTHSKAQILQDYLNTIYFGRGAYGIEAASRAYFGRSVSTLGPAQGAVLAASIRAPTLYDPTTHPVAAKGRWNYVVDGMVSQGWLSASERAALRYPSVLAVANDPSSGARGPSGYILDQVKDELARNGFDEAQLASGGYIVQTTIRQAAQAAAVQAVQAAVKPGDGGAFPVQGALVSIKPDTGEIYAYYGGRVGAGAFDYASGGSGVQPGSSMKPYVLAAALKQGIGLGTQVDGSSPQTIGGVTVNNDPGDPPFGLIDLPTATKYSVNTAYYNLTNMVGPTAVADLAHAAGIPQSDKLYVPGQNNNQPTLGITLGIYGVHVIDQASGYATFAAGGEHVVPFFVKSVTDSSRNVLYTGKIVRTRAFSQPVAADATYAMQQVVQPGGTGAAAQLANRPTAGKTGTTESYTNAWFCGFTPQLATAVWVGREQGKPLVGVLGSGSGIYGGTVPAQIFKSYMDAALQGQPVMNFPPRANVGQSVNPTPSFSAVTPSPTTTPTPTPTPSPSPTASLPATVPPALPPPSQGGSPGQSPASSPPPNGAPPNGAPPPPSPTAS